MIIDFLEHTLTQAEYLVWILCFGFGALALVGLMGKEADKFERLLQKKKYLLKVKESKILAEESFKKDEDKAKGNIGG